MRCSSKTLKKVRCSKKALVGKKKCSIHFSAGVKRGGSPTVHTANGPKSYNDLPEELKVHILSKVKDSKTLRSVRRVNSQHHRIALDKMSVDGIPNVSIAQLKQACRSGDSKTVDNFIVRMYSELRPSDPTVTLRNVFHKVITNVENRKDHTDTENRNARNGLYSCMSDALNGSHTKVIKILLKAGIYNDEASYDWALTFASSYSSAEVVRLLLKAGADIHANDDEALREAVKKNKPENVIVLLKAGAHVHAKNDEAFREAKSKNYITVMNILNAELNNKN